MSTVDKSKIKAFFSDIEKMLTVNGDYILVDDNMELQSWCIYTVKNGKLYDNISFDMEPRAYNKDDFNPVLQIIKIALEKYKISRDNKNYVILKNKNSGKVLSINGGSAKNSANIEQRDYKDEKSQKWIAVKQTNGRIVFLSALDADYCVDLQAAIAANLTS